VSIELIILLTLILLVIAFIHFFRCNDEFLLILPLFFLATGISRYYTVINGYAKWVTVKYAVAVFRLSNELALVALNLFFWGTTIFFFSYYITYNLRPKNKLSYENQDLFVIFLSHHKYKLFVLFGIFLIINSYVKIVLSNTQAVAYGMSYFYLFSLAIGGIILLIFLLYKNTTFKRHFPIKVFVLIVTIYAAYISFNPILRFQFISWMVAVSIVIVKDYTTIQKLRVYIAGGIFVVGFFSLTGNWRLGYGELSAKEQVDLAMKRIQQAEDQNMLDGFMMVLQVYPKLLDYHYGMEHFEILLRPIPRALWAGKPVGGYTNKLKLNENMPNATTVGISQSIYGTFYGEGGVIGIIIFSVIYGILFVKFFRYADRYNSDMKHVIKGVVISSTIPLLRGGDLPGIIAFIGMSYWPVFVYLILYNKFLQRYHLAQYVEEMNRRTEIKMQAHKLKLSEKQIDKEKAKMEEKIF